jgi:hypothetical protein
MKNPVSKLESRWRAKQDRKILREMGIQAPQGRVRKAVSRILRWLKKVDEPEAPEQAPRNRAERRALFFRVVPRAARKQRQRRWALRGRKHPINEDGDGEGCVECRPFLGLF